MVLAENVSIVSEHLRERGRIEFRLDVGGQNGCLKVLCGVVPLPLAAEKHRPSLQDANAVVWDYIPRGRESCESAIQYSFYL